MNKSCQSSADSITQSSKPLLGLTSAPKLCTRRFTAWPSCSCRWPSTLSIYCMFPTLWFSGGGTLADQSVGLCQMGAVSIICGSTSLQANSAVASFPFQVHLSTSKHLIIIHIKQHAIGILKDSTGAMFENPSYYTRSTLFKWT